MEDAGDFWNIWVQYLDFWLRVPKRKIPFVPFLWRRYADCRSTIAEFV